MSTNCLAQAKAKDKSPLYRALVETTDNKRYSGVVYGLSDSTINLTNIQLAKSNQVPIDREALVIPVKSIKLVRFVRVGAIGKGALLGALLGSLIGGALGNVMHEDSCDPVNFSGSYYGCLEIFDRKDSTVIGAVLGATAGSTIGIISSSKSHTYKINGNRESYLAQKENFRSFLYTPVSAP